LNGNNSDLPLVALPINNPYSLGILIEWKLENVLVYIIPLVDPYSLGILIEWKPHDLIAAVSVPFISLLARDIN